MTNLSKPRSRAVIELIVCALLACVCGCGGSGREPDVPDVAASEDSSDGELATQINNFCGGCHAMPRPSSFPKHAWQEEVDQGFNLFADSGRTDLTPVSPVSTVVDYFRSRAPYSLEIPAPDSSNRLPPVGFIKERFELLPGRPPVFVSHILSVPGTDQHDAGLLLCDMKQGDLLWTDPSKPSQPSVPIATFDNPAHVEATDLDGDGSTDYVVSDLGAFFPEDHTKGKVYWLKLDVDSGQWQKRLLLSDIGRVCGVEAADFDSDGKLDLVVAEFGWRKTGRILFLRNVSESPGNPEFETGLIDNRAGAIHVQQCDLNADGHLDFMTVISQEHETVVAFINRGDGFFQPNTVWSAGFPSYGSSGMQLVDLDQDGDLDVLYTNGDSFDDAFIKPYHSVQWLENQGTYPFVHHDLAKMPGVHRALPGDFDGDGDVDIVAVAMLPNAVLNRQQVINSESVILLEQTEDKKFVRYGLEVGDANHPSLEVGDFDGDSDLDLAVGVFWNEIDPIRLTIWWNQLKI